MVKRLWQLGHSQRWKMLIQLTGQWLSELLVVSVIWAGSQWILTDSVNPLWFWLIGIQLIIMVIYMIAIPALNKNGWAVAASRDLQDQYLSAYLKTTVSDEGVMQVLHQDLRTLKGVAIFFDTIIPTILQLILTAILVLVIGLFVHPITLLIPLAGILLLGMSMGMLQGMGNKTNLAYIGSFNHMGQRFLDDFLGMSSLIMDQRQTQYAHDFASDSEDYRQKTMNVLKYQLQSLTIMDFFLYGAIGVFLFAQGHAIASGTLALSTAIGLSTLVAVWLIDFRKFGYFMHVFMSTLPKIKHLFVVIDEAPVATNEDEIQLNNIENISLDGSFGYEKSLFETENLVLSPGQIIGLTGPSGSGKSTLAKTLMQQIPLLDGKITINSQIDLSQIEPLNWLKHVAYLGPTTVLFDGSIKNNLLLGPHPDDWQQKLQDSNLCQFIADFPEGFETQVGENGSQLSPGQRQQIAVARAILADKEVYILDEVTSNIDPENADSILEAIKQLASQKIVLLITHRLADLQQLSQLYLVSDHRLVSGDFESLQANVPEFKQLVTAQENLLKEAGLQ